MKLEKKVVREREREGKYRGHPPYLDVFVLFLDFYLTVLSNLPPLPSFYLFLHPFFFVSTGVGFYFIFEWRREEGRPMQRRDIIITCAGPPPPPPGGGVAWKEALICHVNFFSLSFFLSSSLWKMLVYFPLGIIGACELLLLLLLSLSCGRKVASKVATLNKRHNLIQFHSSGRLRHYKSWEIGLKWFEMISTDASWEGYFFFDFWVTLLFCFCLPAGWWREGECRQRRRGCGSGVEEA